MTTEELMEFFKNAYKKERENSNKLCILKDEEIERLQEQLKEANEIISIYRCYDDTECGKATEYCKKWGVK